MTRDSRPFPGPRGRLAAVALCLCGLLWGPSARAGASAADSARVLASADSLAQHKDKDAVAVIQRACEAAGGLEAYRKLKDIRFDLVETRFHNQQPLPGTRSKLMFRLHGSLQYRQESEDGSVIAADGTRGWKRTHGVVSTSSEDSAGAMVGARLYCFWNEVPFNLLDVAQGIVSLGEVKVHLQPYDVVMTTMTVSSPRNIDTYFLYFEHDTGRLRGFTFTIAAMGKLVPDLAVWFDDFAPVGKLILPQTQRFYGVTKDNYPDLSAPFHEYQKSNIQFDTGLDDSLFRVPKP